MNLVHPLSTASASKRVGSLVSALFPAQNRVWVDGFHVYLVDL